MVALEAVKGEQNGVVFEVGSKEQEEMVRGFHYSRWSPETQATTCPYPLLALGTDRVLHGVPHHGLKAYLWQLIFAIWLGG